MHVCMCISMYVCMRASAHVYVCGATEEDE